MKIEIRDVTRTTDQYGDSTEVETTRWWDAWAVAPRVRGSESISSERSNPREPAILSGVTAYGPPVDIGPNDRLRISGRWYQVEGEPGYWKSPWSDRDGLEVALSRWEQP